MFGTADLPNGVRLRPATSADAATERRLHDSNRQDLDCIDADTAFVQEIKDFQYKAKTTGHGEAFPNAFYFMIEKNGDVVGRLSIDFGPNELRIVDLSLFPQWQGKGIGTTVLRAMQTVAGSMALPVALGVDRFRPQTIRLYQSLGFELDPDFAPTQTHLWLRWLPSSAQMPTHVFMKGA